MVHVGLAHVPSKVPPHRRIQITAPQEHRFHIVRGKAARPKNAPFLGYALCPCPKMRRCQSTSATVHLLPQGLEAVMGGTRTPLRGLGSRGGWVGTPPSPSGPEIVEGTFFGPAQKCGHPRATRCNAVLHKRGCSTASSDMCKRQKANKKPNKST